MTLPPGPSEWAAEEPPEPLTTLVAAALAVALAAVRVPWSWAQRRPAGDESPIQPTVDALYDAALRGTAAGVAIAGRVGRIIRSPFELAVDLTRRPPLLPRELWPETVFNQLARRGRLARTQAERDVERVGLGLAVAVIERVLDRLDLTKLVLDRVDISVLAAAIDVNEIADRLDLERILARADLNEIATRLDLNAIAARLDIDPIIARVDVDGIAATLDLDRVIARIDITGIANEVIDDIQLPEIIREASGAMASETVLGVRMRGIEADQRINRLVDHLLLRRRARVDRAPTDD